jgi:prophage DNA circulation protein
VDNPANQFANILSIEKVNGQNVVSGYLSKAEIENVFWDSENNIVMVSELDSATSPVTGNKMQNIGFIEKNDKDNTEMIKFLVDSAKGINTIKITKEVNPMTESTEAVVETAVENAQVAPEAQATEVVAEATEIVAEAEKIVAEATETAVVAEEVVAVEELAMAKSDDASADSSVAKAAVEVENAVEKSIADVKEEVAKAVSEINTSLTNAFGDLAATIKSLNEKVTAVTKSLDAVTSDVNGIKSNFNEFGKRVDLVEQDTAFRKSGDLGEIVQESPQVIHKSLWGGRFLTNADLFN